MKQILFSLLFLVLAAPLNAKPVKVSKIEPANWYVGMKDPTLQLMVYGENIRETDVTTDYPGVRIDSVARLGSPNYLLVYLNLEGAQPGTMTLKFTARKDQNTLSAANKDKSYFDRAATDVVKGTQTVAYQLKQREMSGDKRMGFTNADVLYMLMPDRFANGTTPEKTLNKKPTKQTTLNAQPSSLNPQRSTLNSQPSTLNPYTIDRTQPSLRHGGNLEGIRQHLDYFNELGVTALWLTPVLENNAPDSNNGFSTYHGYATTDYYSVDPRFGSNDDYRKLIDEAHQKGLKVVMDMIFNHCGFNHPWVQDVPSSDWFNKQECIEEADKAEMADRSKLANKAVKSRMGTGDFDDAYIGKAETYLQTSYKLTPTRDPYASDIDKMETEEGWFVPTMPDLNHHNPHLMKYLIQNSIWWIETVGIDGIRMDTYPYAFGEDMAKWMKTLNSEYPNFNVVGETWVTEPAFTAAWQKDSRLIDNSQLSIHNSQLIIDNCLADGKQCCSGADCAQCDNCKHATDNCQLSNVKCQFNTFLPCVMDFSFFEKLSMAKNEETDPWWKGLNRIYNSFVYDYLYANPNNVLAFIDNHDTDRFLGNGCDTLALKQALAMLLTVKRTPQLYYGTEILMNGTKEVTDGNVRKDFPGGFPGDSRNAFTAEGRTPAENSMFNWLARLLHWRQGNDIIIRGKMKQFIPFDGVYVIARQIGDHGVIVVLNGTSEEKTIDANRYAELFQRNGGSAAIAKKDSNPKEILQQTKDVITGESVGFGGKMHLTPRQTLILEY